MSAIAALFPVHLPTPRGRRLTFLFGGLTMFGASLALLVAADFGLDPWDVLHQGIARTFGVRLGVVVVATSIVVLLTWIPLHQRPGIGTIANALVVGLVFEITAALLPDLGSTFARVIALAVGIVGNAAAVGLYVGAGLGPGPRDGLMTGLAARGRSLRAVRTGIEITVLTAGWSLGGTVGVGTIVYAVTIGPLIQRFLPVFAGSVDRPSSRPAGPAPVRQLHPREATPCTTHPTS